MNRTRRLDLIICLILSLSTLLVYWDLPGHQFISIDDAVYVTDNPHVRSGLTRQNLVWAFTTTRAEFWHPLTWLSYMLDSHAFGVYSSGYLFTNLLLHALNSILVFLVFKRMTGATWQSGFLAALFALHPLHVESVAWIAARKDVLSTFFWMLTMRSYIHYTECPGPKRFLAVCLFLALGLMAKPMLVTLPFVLLLLDCWPLARYRPGHSLKNSIASFWILIREKIPLFVLTVTGGILAFFVQKSAGGISPFETYPFTDRIANAIVSYVAYLEKMIWPRHLAVFYPFPDNFPAWKVGGSLLLLIAITILALKSAKRHPFFIIGWLWYLGTLVPVIGLIKIGDFAMADRYTYIPLIGPFIIIAWGLPEIFADSHLKKMIVGAVALIALTALGAVTHSQLKFWANSRTLFDHALQVTQNNFFAHFGLGRALATQGEFAQAAAHFSKAVNIKPRKATLHNDLGRALAIQGKFNQSAPHLLEALRIKPDFGEAHFILANVLVAQGDYCRAIYHFSEALRLHPDFSTGKGRQGHPSVTGYPELRSMYATNEAVDQAIDRFKQQLSVDPGNYDALRKLAITYSNKGDYDRAFKLLRVDKSTHGRIQAVLKGYTLWKPET